MLPEDYTESDVRHVLDELGNPKDLAFQYNPDKRYLIGPGYYDQYISVLKLVTGIAASVMGGIFILSWILNEPDAAFDLSYGVAFIVQFTVGLLSYIIQGVMQAVLWVTIIFIILERSGAVLDDKAEQGRAWRTEDLKEIPAPESAISRVGIIMAIVFSILFIALIWFRPELISIFVLSDEGITRTPFLELDRLRLYLPLFMTVTLLEIALLIWQYVSGRWTRPLAMGNAIVNVLVIGTSIFALKDSSLFNPQFVQEMGNVFQQNAVQAAVTMDRIRAGILAFIILLTLWDTFDVFRKSRKDGS